MPTSDIGIDLGTRNSLAYSTGKGLVLNEPSIVVYDKNTEKIRAIGEEARLMEGRITSDMEIIRPIRQGVIVDYTVTEKMLSYFISRTVEILYIQSNRKKSFPQAQDQYLCSQWNYRD